MLSGFIQIEIVNTSKKLRSTLVMYNTDNNEYLRLIISKGCNSNEGKGECSVQ